MVSSRGSLQLSDALPADLSVGSTSIGVVVGPSPTGPWHDPIGKPLLANGSDYTPATQIRDPGVLQDGADYYIVFGTFERLLRAISLSTYLTLLRPFLAHFCSFFPRCFAVPFVSPPRFRKPVPRPGKTLRNGRKTAAKKTR